MISSTVKLPVQEIVTLYSQQAVDRMINDFL